MHAGRQESREGVKSATSPELGIFRVKNDLSFDIQLIDHVLKSKKQQYVGHVHVTCCAVQACTVPTLLLKELKFRHARHLLDDQPVILVL